MPGSKQIVNPLEQFQPACKDNTKIRSSATGARLEQIDVYAERYLANWATIAFRANRLSGRRGRRYYQVGAKELALQMWFRNGRLPSSKTKRSPLFRKAVDGRHQRWDV